MTLHMIILIVIIIAVLVLFSIETIPADVVADVRMHFTETPQSGQIALQIDQQEAFETALSEFEGTILAIAHDQYFIDRFAQVIWYFSEDGVNMELTPAFVSETLSL